MKFKNFLLGLLVGLSVPLFVIGVGFIYLTYDVEKNNQGLVNDQTRKDLAEEAKQKTLGTDVIFEGNLDLAVGDKKSIFNKGPLYLYVTLIPRDRIKMFEANAYSQESLFLAKEVGTITSFPYKMSFGIKSGYFKFVLDKLKNGSSTSPYDIDQEFSVVLYASYKKLNEMKQFYLSGNTVSNEKLINFLEPIHTPFNFRLELVSRVSTNDLAKGTAINYGNIFFREHFSKADELMLDNNIPCIHGDLSIKIKDLSGTLSSAINKKSLYVLSLPDDYSMIVIQANGVSQNYSDLFTFSSEVWPNFFSGNTISLSAQPVFKENQIYSSLYLVQCPKGDKIDACLKSATNEIVNKRNFNIKDFISPLVPENLELPICTSNQVNLYYYPFNRPVTSANQIQLSTKQKTLPPEIIE